MTASLPRPVPARPSLGVRAGAAWVAFFHAPSTGRRLGALRIAVGLIVLAGRLGLHGLWGAPWARAGLHGLPSVTEHLAGFPAPYPAVAWLPGLSLSGSLALDWVVLGLVVLFTLGVLMPWSGALLAIGLAYPMLISQFAYAHHRVLLVILVLVISWGGGGRTLSILMARRGRAALRPTSATVAPLRLLQLLVTTIYLPAVAFKLNEGWFSGRVFLALADDDYLRPLGLAAVAAVPLRLLGMGTLVVECAVALGLWHRRLRLPAALLGTAFHLAIDAALDVGTYSYTMVALYAAYWLDAPLSHAKIPGDDARQT